MGLAWLLTLLALGGAALGVFAGRAARPSDHFAAAGGGLLFGIASFWLIPEAGDLVGSIWGFLLAAGVALLLLILDRVLARRGHTASRGVIWPLLLATAIHSLLDGWSVRLLGVQPLTNFAATAGLALHKIPEGAALGWVTRRAIVSTRQAFVISGSAELFTLAGAFAEPALNASGAARFGLWWTAGILSAVAGGFLFLGLHALEPARHRPLVLATFLGTVLLAGSLTFLHST